jgi:hypothetical protein
VASGYFHERHPERHGALSLPKRQDGADGTPRPRPSPAALIRNVASVRRQHSDRGAQIDGTE